RARHVCGWEQAGAGVPPPPGPRPAPDNRRRADRQPRPADQLGDHPAAPADQRARRHGPDGDPRRGRRHRPPEARRGPRGGPDHPRRGRWPLPPGRLMIGFVAFSLKRAWQGFWRNALMSIAATATMVLMLVLLSGFWIIQTGLLSALDFTEQKVEVTANLQLDATQADIDGLESRIKAMPQVTTVTFVSKEEALARFQQSMKDQGREDLTRYIDENPFSASFEVKLVDPGQS